MHFHHLFEVETDVFEGLPPRPDAVNDMIGGDEMAAWLHSKLRAAGHACEPVVAEDHGWDFDVRADRRRYRVVCSCDFLDDSKAADLHFVQVAQTKGEPLHPDLLLGAVRAILTANSTFAITSDGPAGR